MERLILFAKAPRLGAVKTRLVPPLTAEQALDLHRAFVDDQIRFVAACCRRGREGILALAEPAESLPESAVAAALGLEVAPQGDGDLGERMVRAFSRAFSRGADAAAILGADAPTLPAALVDEVFERLEAGADAVIVPASDGGYVMIGLRGPHPEIFADVEWGTGTVALSTRVRARVAGVRLEQTLPWHDVDLPADLDRLAAEVARDPLRAPATARVVARLPRNR
ncbi:MAG TPA: TIGR04282 family arsenosugar biosynthesis glycosyltransferase [Candidatus Polarisedimenticolaceae bacterium]